MAFSQKTWAKRLSEYPTRRQLTYTDGTTAIVDVARSEGTISAEGDAFSDTNMNDLEQRIADAFDECFQSVSNFKALVASAITDKGVETAEDATGETMAANIAKIETRTEGGTLVLFKASEGGIAPTNGAKITDISYVADYFSVSSNVYTCKKAGTYKFFAGGDMIGAPKVVITNSSGTTLAQYTFTRYRGVTISYNLAVGDKVYFAFTETPSSSTWTFNGVVGAYI